MQEGNPCGCPFLIPMRLGFARQNAMRTCRRAHLPVHDDCACSLRPASIAAIALGETVVCNRAMRSSFASRQFRRDTAEPHRLDALRRRLRRIRSGHVFRGIAVRRNAFQPQHRIARVPRKTLLDDARPHAPLLILLSPTQFHFEFGDTPFIPARHARLVGTIVLTPLPLTHAIGLERARIGMPRRGPGHKRWRAGRPAQTTADRRR